MARSKANFKAGPSPQARGSLVAGKRTLAASGSIPAGAGKPPVLASKRIRTGVHPRRRGEADTIIGFADRAYGPSPQARGSRGGAAAAGVPIGSIPAGAGKPGDGGGCHRLFSVHPRRRGEASPDIPNIGPMRGPSPQARGSRAPVPHDARGRGSIPAGAGKPTDGRSSSPSRPVHPRRRGEAIGCAGPGCCAGGPSPQARGSQMGDGGVDRLEGSIPAGAGKPSACRAPCSRRRVHPRRRGEAPSAPTWGGYDAGPSPQARGSRLTDPKVVVLAGSIPAGAGKPLDGLARPVEAAVHPRRRGEAGEAEAEVWRVEGPSPQARGSRRGRGRGVARRGSIPAGAGKPRAPLRAIAHLTVHPRRRGEAVDSTRVGRDGVGPSPQARGSRAPVPHDARGRGSIPAGAGKPALRPRASPTSAVHPRRRGEAAVGHVDLLSELGPSPQARGSRPQRPRPVQTRGSIPAGAGKPSRPGGRRRSARVHPRRRGEAIAQATGAQGASGPSPQARGSHRHAPHAPAHPRSIPAGAGKPPAGHSQHAPDGVHPRRRGEASPVRPSSDEENGPSPQARGSHRPAHRGRGGRGSIPAGAGKPRGQVRRRSRSTVHPRRRGEALSEANRSRTQAGPSPQARGSPDMVAAAWRRRRSIPAGAGKPA